MSSLEEEEGTKKDDYPKLLQRKLANDSSALKQLEESYLESEDAKERELLVVKILDYKFRTDEAKSILEKEDIRENRLRITP